jgi:uncharacterized caspase-like protein
MQCADTFAGTLLESQAPWLAMRIKTSFRLITLSPNKHARYGPECPVFSKILLLRRNMNHRPPSRSCPVQATSRKLVKRF